MICPFGYMVLPFEIRGFASWMHIFTIEDMAGPTKCVTFLVGVSCKIPSSFD